MSYPPSEIYQGDNAEWKQTDDDFAGSHTAKTIFVDDGENANKVEIAGVIASNVATFTLTPALSSTLTPGVMRWAIIKTLSTTEREVIAEGTIRVKWNPETSNRPQSHARTMLGLIETRLQGQAVEGEETISYLDVSVTFHNMRELEELRRYYQREVAAEERRDQGRPPAGIRFGRVRLTGHPNR